MPTLAHNGGEIYYEVAGEGSPLVLIHAGVADQTMWDYQWTAFTARHRTIRYDTRGWGKTTSTDVTFSNRDDLRALLDNLGVAKAAVMGVSRGGQIATDFTLEFPERVSALIPVAAGLGGFEAPVTPAEEALFAAAEAAGERKAWDELTDLEVQIWVQGPYRRPNEVDSAVLDHARRMIRGSYALHESETLTPITLTPPAVGRLAEIACPTLVIWGDKDVSEVAANCEALVAGIAGARKVILPNAAHLPNMEYPEKFAEMVLSFLGSI